MDATTTYTVSFDSAGGSSVASQTVRKNSKASQPATPTRSGYSFAGWYSGSTKYDFSTPVTSNLKLTAHWAQNTVYRTVSFDSAGGSAVAAQRVADGSKARQPVNPTRSGYMFQGWYSGNVKWDFTTAVRSDLKLTARWSKNPPQVTYRTVSFDSTGGSSVASQKVADGAKASQPTPPTRSGYSFAGWYNGSTRYDFTTPVKSDLRLTARWTKNSTTTPPAQQVPVYRVYNRNSGLHHYTTNKAENDMLVRLGWRDENHGRSSFITVSKDTPGARPVYREYNRRSGNHNWTLNKAEHDMLVRLGWRNEGVAWYTSPKGQNVYRLYNPKPYHKPRNGRGNGGGEHVYTTSYGEYLAVIRAGWRGEGIAWQSL
ncbi:InlB B-repeat-containing protein [Bifidobacterium simiarum]|uniref:InlB B-repeat-containing protein n=1 Tax=Bifidobacterium simiarum TaxID=2045441 RepID=UPI001BDBCD20|nr:InlB B-repeat-containing protein [Bifidobacterium simiarum]MBT1167310.1 InlB B-repeat-containing protein [Bifidobacterium simiarum]